MIQQLDIWDRQLFEFLNGLNHPFMDQVMWLISTKSFWFPFYGLLLFIFFLKLGWKQTAWLIFCTAILITISDQVASGFLKPYVQRFRPCQVEAGLDFLVHIVNGKCGGKYGFVSSHSANFFAMAGFFSLFFEKNWRIILFLIAIAVAYSRVYLGVHYPGDIIGGAIVGLFAAWIARKLFRFGEQKLWP